MKEQAYHNHKRLHPPYHFVLMPAALIPFIGAIVHLFPAFRGGGGVWFAVLLLIAAFALLLAAGLIRGYATKLQDRIVRAEENFRHYALTGRALDARLTLAQIIALRFADDSEFAALCERAVKEQLKPDQIKQAIQTWRADWLRV